MRSIVPFICLTALAGAALAQTVDVPHVTQEMRTPAFWIKHHASPDKLMMAPSDIKAFNASLASAGLINDLSVFPSTYDGRDLTIELQRSVDDLARQSLFNARGFTVDDGFYKKMKEAMVFAELPIEMPVRRAVTVVFTDQRLLPTDDPLYEKPGDVDFDQLQNSGIDPATPVVVLHESFDGKWLYVKDGIAAGWVHAEDIAFVDEPMWNMFWEESSSVVVTAARTLLWGDPHKKGPIAVVRMGARLIVPRLDGDMLAVVLPQRGVGGKVFWITAYVSRADVVRRALPYTARNIYVQAFKMLDAPYGWGDMHQQQDCSRFTHMVFATVGLTLPRNSGEQAQVGAEVSWKDAAGAMTLLRLKGHIMLYLGKADEKPYAIHAAWAYREKGDVVKLLKRVVVSDLSLGEGSSKGSLLERIVALRFIGGQIK
jgi:hypothetical protein